MPDVVFYHEDFYRQIELIPEENYFKVAIDIKKLPSNEDLPYGFDNILIRQEHLVKTSDLKITLSQIKEILLPISINYFPNVTTGYSDNTQIKKNTIAFGFERLGIFVEFDKEEIVANIWLCLSLSFTQSQNCKKLLPALQILGSSFNLALIDWDEEIIVRISKLLAAQNYLIDVFGFMIPDK